MMLSFADVLDARARSMRSNMTPAERKMSESLIETRLTWVSQQPMCGRYIVDFWCEELAVVVEVNGAGHYSADGLEKDVARDEALAKAGILALHVENDLILSNEKRAMRRVRSILWARAQQRGQTVPFTIDATERNMATRYLRGERSRFV